MNPSEAAPLLPGMQRGFHQPAAPPPRVQYTTVHINAEPPKDYIIWSLFSFLHGNVFCLGLIALIFSVKARDRKMVGDHSGAQSYGATARLLNIIAAILLVLAVIGAIIAVVVTSRENHRPYGYFG